MHTLIFLLLSHKLKQIALTSLRKRYVSRHSSCGDNGKPCKRLRKTKQGAKDLPRQTETKKTIIPKMGRFSVNVLQERIHV